MPARRPPQDHRRLVFGASIDSIERDLLPALDTGILDAEHEALVRSSIGRLLMQLGDNEIGLAQLERAVDELPERSLARAASLLWLGWPYGSPRPVEWHLAQVRRAAQAFPDDLSPADRLMLDRLYVTRLLFLGDEAGWRLTDRIPDTADDQQVALQAVLGHADLAYACLLWGRYRRAHQHLLTAGRLSERWYFAEFIDAVESTEVHLDWYLGRWEGLAERALSLTTTGHDRFARLESMLVAGALSTACGLPERSGTHPEMLLGEMAEHEAPELLALAAAEAARRRLAVGNIAGADEVTVAATQTVLTTGSWLYAMEIVPVRIEVLVAGGRAAEAETLHRRFAGMLVGRTGDRPAAALAAAGAALLHRDHPGPAADELGRAVELLRGLPRPYDAAQARIRRAELLLAADRRDEAIAELRTGRAALADLRAWPLVAEVEAQLGRLGVRGAAGPGRGRKPYGDVLSPRERDVVRLVARGLTDRQIAGELVLSVKTVANHVATARRKLRAPSRTALAVAAIGAGIIAHPAEQPTQGTTG
jgi:DNA-binding CsgD family transcriptional regulator